MCKEKMSIELTGLETQKHHSTSSGEGPWLHHITADGITVVAHARGRDHIARQETRKQY